MEITVARAKAGDGYYDLGKANRTTTIIDHLKAAFPGTTFSYKAKGASITFTINPSVNETTFNTEIGNYKATLPPIDDGPVDPDE